MITARQVERLFRAADYARLLHDLTSHRADGLIRWDARANRQTLAAAMAAIRLDELNLAGHPLNAQMIQVILRAQEADGGWGDAVVTALCIRALLARSGDGVAVSRGLAYLANLQQDAGTFPAGPFRRMPADSHGTAAVAYLLADQMPAWALLDVGLAVEWLESHNSELDITTKVIARTAATRCRRTAVPAMPARGSYKVA